MKIRFMLAFALGTAMLFTSVAWADDYVIDTKGAHAFIQFRIKHLGYSWLLGRFNRFSGTFTFDENDPNKARVQVVIDTASIDSNHAERDKHLRGEDFLDVKRYPEARFVSTSFEDRGDGTTRPVTIDVQHVGNGPDPWGGYRRGFEGRTSLALADFGIDYNLGPASKTVDLFLSVEGIRQ